MYASHNIPYLSQALFSALLNTEFLPPFVKLSNDSASLFPLSEEASDSAATGEATSSMDQYSLTLEMLKQEVEDSTTDAIDEYIEEESIEEEAENLTTENVDQKAKDENEQQEIDPV